MDRTERIDVEFTSKNSEYGNCICTACHGSAFVTKIKMPETLFHDGKRLSTRYSDYWLCPTCKNKLIKALLGGEA